MRFFKTKAEIVKATGPDSCGSHQKKYEYAAVVGASYRVAQRTAKA
jgi:hypothetical protein